jgi:peptidoglycan hydrolase-like protein with peptidoglycan-binding domain
MSSARTRHVLVPLLAATAISLPAAGAADAKPLKKGSHGARVKVLQRDLGLSPADGIFGKGTYKAVRRFQRKHRLAVDGIVGTVTWRLVHHSRARTSRASGGKATASRGGSVALLQRKLGIAADGVFGPGTARAVKAFQRRRGLTADGVVGPGTWAALGVRGGHPVLKRSRVGGGVTVARHTILLRRAVAAANRIAYKPYVYGGGHGSFSASGYDCSGTVSYVLHGMGRLGRPMDSGELMSYGKAGRGRFITIYANASHAFMVINGRRYDTSVRANDGSRWGPGMRSTAGYVARHPAGL